MRYFFTTFIVCFATYEGWGYGYIDCPKKSIKEAVEQADIIFTGRILTQEAFSSPDTSSMGNPFSYRMIKYLVSCEKLFKGDWKSDTIVVVSDDELPGGYKFTVGEQYIIYCEHAYSNLDPSHPEERKFITSICDRTRNINEKEIKRIGRYLKKKD